MAATVLSDDPHPLLLLDPRIRGMLSKAADDAQRLIWGYVSNLVERGMGQQVPYFVSSTIEKQVAGVIFQAQIDVLQMQANRDCVWCGGFTNRPLRQDENGVWRHGSKECVAASVHNHIARLRKGQQISD